MSSKTYNYVVTAHKPTAVTACTTGHLTSPSDLNLIVAKNNRIEIHLVTPSGLKLLKDINIYGKITCMKLFTPQDTKKDLLFILTAKYSAMILECRRVDDDVQIVTKAYGNIEERIGKPCETGMLAVVDPQARCIVLRLCEGTIKVIPLVLDSSELQAYSIRLEELQIQDLEFLYGCADPTLILIYQDNAGRHVKTHEIRLRDKEFNKTPCWKQDHVENEASMIIPMPEPLGGTVIVGQETLTYLYNSTHTTIAPPQIKTSTIVCYGRVDEDGSRHLLGDISGRLFMLLIDRSDVNAVKMTLELLGDISVPECITYLDNGVVFIGSRLGDSQLVRLNSEKEDNSYVTVMQTYNNLAPIVDMVVVDLEKQGQGQLVTCSGAYREGSLRIIRNGIGIQEIASMRMDIVKGMWSLKVMSEFHNVIVVSCVSFSRILAFDDDNVEEIDIGGFVTNEQTFYAANAAHSFIIQGARSGIYLVSQATRKLVSHWTPPDNRNISVLSSNDNQIVAASGEYLYYLTIESSGLCLQKSVVIEYEVACIDLSPLKDQDMATSVAIGLWTDISARILSLPDLTEYTKESLGGDIIPRSIVLASFGGQSYVLVSMGDGQLNYFIFDPITRSLTEKKRAALGTKPTILKKFQSGSSMNVFACSDRPTVIYSSNHKLVFSKVNLKEVTHMCPLDAKAYPNSLALATGDGITIGTIDEIQKLHIRTVPLGETPRRIAYQEQTETFGVLSMRMDTVNANGEIVSNPLCASNAAGSTSSSATMSHMKINLPVVPEPGQEIEVQNLLIISQNTFEVLHVHQFHPAEYALSICSCELKGSVYYAVGTAVINPEETDPKHGRIVLFSYKDGKLTQVAEKENKGACYTVCEFQGKLLAAISNTVRLFEWMPENNELRFECSHFNNIMALFLKTKGDFILVGDLMRSFTLLQFKTLESSFEEIAHDYQPNWMTAVEILDDDLFLGAEHGYNLFVGHKDSAATLDEERQQMQTVGRFYLGDYVSVFRHGSLVMQAIPESSTLTHGCVLFGTAHGSLGLVTTLSPDTFDLLSQVQDKLATTIKSVGKIDHSFYRSFRSDKRMDKCEGFIDGDLIESYLDLPSEVAKEICQGIYVNEDDTRRPITKDDLSKIIEELTRIH